MPENQLPNNWVWGEFGDCGWGMEVECHILKLQPQRAPGIREGTYCQSHPPIISKRSVRVLALDCPPPHPFKSKPGTHLSDTF